MPGMSRPVHLPDPHTNPEPAPGCDVCRELVKQRAEARKRREHGRAALCTVEIGQHPHPQAARK
ncbi:hypothetical protein GCM10010211_77560 [Streptomyces albospinus]|uniref:Uncharacterized protein n=1 Tax=Streptomyces albospinus TaxID=285515 RepID=A0ABQ2VM90_9ACTN|nr:hypothetical protein GCM10010211_77560 [Streptomyces albospinus]